MPPLVAANKVLVQIYQQPTAAVGLDPLSLATRYK